MRYQMKQKIFAFGDDFKIVDGDGVHVATVDGRVFSLGKKLDIVSPAGAEIVRIEQKLIALKPTYEIWQQKKLLATVSKDFFTLFRCSFTVDVPGPNDLSAQGSFTEHEYRFERQGKRVAEVSKAWFGVRDTYGVDVEAGEDPWLVLASTVVIDLCCHNDDAAADH